MLFGLVQNLFPGAASPQPLETRTARGFAVLLVCVAACLLLPRSFAGQSGDAVRFRSPYRSLIVVDVRVNGLGPYQFVLDTGATSSCVDEELSAALGLPAAKGVRLATWTGTGEVRRVAVENLSLGPVNSGPLQVLVQSLAEFKGIAAHLHGILGQDVLLRFNYLIDNGAHRIEFDMNGSLLLELRGERVSTSSVQTEAGALEGRLRSVAVRAEIRSAPLQMVLDSGADMVVLQPRFRGASPFGPTQKWIANDDGRRSAAVSLKTTLTVGTEVFSADAWIGTRGLSHLAVDGLLPTSCFRRLYISNTGSFVILEARRASRRRE